MQCTTHRHLPTSKPLQRSNPTASPCNATEQTIDTRLEPIRMLESNFGTTTRISTNMPSMSHSPSSLHDTTRAPAAHLPTKKASPILHILGNKLNTYNSTFASRQSCAACCCCGCHSPEVIACFEPTSDLANQPNLICSLQSQTAHT